MYMPINNFSEVYRPSGSTASTATFRSSNEQRVYLPVDVRDNIFQRLDILSLVNFGKTCRTFAQLTQQLLQTTHAQALVSYQVAALFQQYQRGADIEQVCYLSPEHEFTLEYCSANGSPTLLPREYNVINRTDSQHFFYYKQQARDILHVVNSATNAVVTIFNPLIDPSVSSEDKTIAAVQPDVKKIPILQEDGCFEFLKFYRANGDALLNAHTLADHSILTLTLAGNLRKWQVDHSNQATTLNWEKTLLAPTREDALVPVCYGSWLIGKVLFIATIEGENIDDTVERLHSYDSMTGILLDQTTIPACYDGICASNTSTLFMYSSSNGVKTIAAYSADGPSCVPKFIFEIKESVKYLRANDQWLVTKTGKDFAIYHAQNGELWTQFTLGGSVSLEYSGFHLIHDLMMCIVGTRTEIFHINSKQFLAVSNNFGKEKLRLNIYDLFNFQPIFSLDLKNRALVFQACTSHKSFPFSTTEDRYHLYRLIPRLDSVSQPAASRPKFLPISSLQEFSDIPEIQAPLPAWQRCLHWIAQLFKRCLQWLENAFKSISRGLD